MARSLRCERISIPPSLPGFSRRIRFSRNKISATTRPRGVVKTDAGSAKVAAGARLTEAKYLRRAGGKSSMSTQGAGPTSDPRLQSGVPVQAVGQTAGLYATKPKPIITGESQAQGIAMFSYRASYEDLTPERRERLKVSVLDSLAWGINSIGAAPTGDC